jgi:hypothetical protein
MSAAIEDISTITCELYCKHGAKYSAHPPVYAIWTAVPDMYNVFTAPHIQSSVFNWTYLRPYWRHLDNSMRVILQTWSHIQRTSSSLYYVDCGPGHIQWNDNTGYSVFNIQLNVSALQLEICRQFSERYTATLVTIQRTTSSLRNVNCGPGHVQCHYSSTYLGFNSQLNVSALLLETSRQFNSRYTANLVPNSAHALQFTLCELWSRDIQCNNSSAYSGFNIQVKVSALILEIYRQFNVRYTANMMPNTAHILQLTLSELWSRTYTM